MKGQIERIKFNIINKKKNHSYLIRKVMYLMSLSNRKNWQITKKKAYKAKSTKKNWKRLMKLCTVITIIN